jgi:hypothetical protein
MNLPQAGRDEIVLSAPEVESLCFLTDHVLAGWRAQFIVTFGQLGTLGVDAMWPQSWGRSYAMCRDCTDQAIALVKKLRTDLTVRDLTPSRARQDRSTTDTQTSYHRHGARRSQHPQ